MDAGNILLSKPDGKKTIQSANSEFQYSKEYPKDFPTGKYDRLSVFLQSAVPVQN